MQMGAGHHNDQVLSQKIGLKYSGNLSSSVGTTESLLSTQPSACDHALGLNSRLFYIRDRNSGLKFLVNTAGTLSITHQNKTELGQETPTVPLRAKFERGNFFTWFRNCSNCSSVECITRRLSPYLVYRIHFTRENFSTYTYQLMYSYRGLKSGIDLKYIMYL